MVNRLVLNLIRGADRLDDSEFRMRTGLEIPVFATSPFLGNIGGPVYTFPDDLDSELFKADEITNPDGDSGDCNRSAAQSSNRTEETGLNAINQPDSGVTGHGTRVV